MNKSYDAIIIGTGQAGPFLAIRMAKLARKVAIIERGPVWRHLRQYRLHSDQDLGCQRPKQRIWRGAPPNSVCSPAAR